MRHVKVNKSLVIECLQELSDIDYQRRVWVKGSPEEVSGFNDVIAALFDDSALSEALDKNDLTFTVNVDEMLVNLDSKISSLPEGLTTKELIETKEWRAITELANKILKMMK